MLLKTILMNKTLSPPFALSNAHAGRTHKENLAGAKPSAAGGYLVALILVRKYITQVILSD